MHGQELATAAAHNLDITIIISNNGTYGTIRMHQERDYPNRVSGTGLVNPDFAALAVAYGGIGVTVTKTEDFAAAFAKARAHKGIALIELRTDPEAIAVGASLSDIRGT
jgi:Thiamine pyrophosphate-requiring enzymes [acetolactate synthase, pyruvate dehydrogenase (cytochrome), glyoxylate carboligase, phosphonopyruvate decarboxylase]